MAGNARPLRFFRLGTCARRPRLGPGVLRFTVTRKVQPEAARAACQPPNDSGRRELARSIDPVLQRLDQLRLSQREWFDRVDRRQETHQSGLQRI